MIIRLLYCVFFLGVVVLPARADVCQRWGKSKMLGELDASLINEASGLAISSQFSDTAYHVNDSGDGPFVYITDLNGNHTRKVTIKNFHPFDVEALAYGNCGDDRCLVIADVGDNFKIRSSIRFVFVRESDVFHSEKPVDPVMSITATFPDGAHDAEGVAMHPNGDVYLITKARDVLNRRAEVARLYVLPMAQVKNGQQNKIVLKKVIDIDFPYYLYETNLWGRLVTGFDIAPSGEKTLFTTYKIALEFALNVADIPTDYTPRKFQYGKDLSASRLKKLEQIEAIAYVDENSFIYSTEASDNKALVPMMKVTCKKKKK